MNRRGYTLVVQRDPGTRWLVGEVVELPGCYTQAADLQSLEFNAREAIASYLEASQGRRTRPEFVGVWRVEVGS